LLRISTSIMDTSSSRFDTRRILRLRRNRDLLCNHPPKRTRRRNRNTLRRSSSSLTRIRAIRTASTRPTAVPLVPRLPRRVREAGAAVWEAASSKSTSLSSPLRRRRPRLSLIIIIITTHRHPPPTRAAAAAATSTSPAPPRREGRQAVSARATRRNARILLRPLSGRGLARVEAEAGVGGGRVRRVEAAPVAPADIDQPRIERSLVPFE
jgi:hypothetical protein